MRLHFLIACCFLLIPSTVLLHAQHNPVDDVDPFIGTGGHGHTFPGATMPFGMVQCSPDAGKSGWDWCSGYHASDSAVIGFSHTHLSGTGCADLGDILLLPALGTDAMDRGYRSTYDHAHEEAYPGYYRVLLDNDIDVELTATRRCGVQRYTYPSADSMLVILDLGYGQDDRSTDCRLTVVSDTLITGYRFSTGWAARQRVYFAMAFSRPIEEWKRANGRWSPPQGTAEGKEVLAALHFGFAGEGDELLVRTAISAVSEEGALANLRAEAPQPYFETYRAAARAAWQRELERVRIESDSDSARRIFTTALYHCMIAPNLYQDVDGRYRGGDDTVHHADFEHATVFSLWDTYRALHPLFTILDPDRVSDWVRSMLAFQRESGLLPVWTLHANETNCMIGYHAVPVVADAFLKGIRGFSGEEALAAMQRSAEQTKGGLKYYNMQEARSLDDITAEQARPARDFSFNWEDVTAVVNGYAESIQGQDIEYHSAIPNVTRALITRATGTPMPIEWSSAPVPEDCDGDVVLYWAAGMSTGKGAHAFTLTVNDGRSITFNTPSSAEQRFVFRKDFDLSGDELSAGLELRFSASMVDEFGDLFGTMMLKVPAALHRPGQPLRLRLEGERAGSTDWVMTFTHAFRSSVAVVSSHGFATRGDTRLQFLRVQIEHDGLPRRVKLQSDATTADLHIFPGFNSYEIGVLEKPSGASSGIKLVYDDATVVERSVRLQEASAPCYIPADVEHESVSKTLEYAYDDWCIAQVAEKLGREEDAARYRARAQYYRTLFDADLGFMRGRNLDGSWRTPFNPRYSTRKQHEYTEGNAWQYSWYVPHDVPGLMALHGGAVPFAARLDSLFTQSSDLEGTGATSDVTGLIGLYAHGNEPSHHIAYLYNYAGQPWKTQRLVRRIMREMYSAGRDGLSGNEDCGQMSAWYVMSAMGLYPVNPCGGQYDIGSPALQRAEIPLGEGRSFVMVAENNSAENVYVQSAELDGVPLKTPQLRHDDIMRGGTLLLRMGPAPSALWNDWRGE
jgi:putative alpha-1,2-mannosidase